MRPIFFVLLLISVLWNTTGAVTDGVTIVPVHNRADQKNPPPRPPLSDFERRVRTLWEAIVSDDPKVAESAFFPRDAFPGLIIKRKEICVPSFAVIALNVFLLFYRPILAKRQTVR